MFVQDQSRDHIRMRPAVPELSAPNTPDRETHSWNKTSAQPAIIPAATAIRTPTFVFDRLAVHIDPIPAPITVPENATDIGTAPESMLIKEFEFLLGDGGGAGTNDEDRTKN